MRKVIERIPFLLLLGLVIAGIIINIKKKIFIWNDNPVFYCWLASGVAILIISLFDHYFYSFYVGIMMTALVFGYILLQTNAPRLTNDDKQSII